jgi:uncharacterized protein YerC
MKKRASELSEQERIKTLDALYTAASSVHGRNSMKLFLRDLLTESERVMLGRRILIARLLLQGTSKEEVGKRLGVGYDTVYRVKRWLEDQFPGYEQAIAGMERELKNRNEKRLYATSALYRLKKKYPLYFLLFPSPTLPKKED